MGKIAFVFSGQGAQYPGMGESLYRTVPAVRRLYDAAEELRPGVREMSFRGTAEELKQTVHTQPAVYLCDLGAALALREAGVEPDMAGGFSLGELPALAFAGAFSPEEGFSLVLKRAEYMAEASERMPGTPAMAAVMRLSPEEIENLCAGIDGVFPANYNAPEQTVISGTAEGVAAFKALAAERGLSARTVDLPVSGAFHTPFMATASERLLPVLEAVTFSRPRVPVRANLTGELYPEDPAGYPAILSAQIRNPVRWTDEIRAMIEAGADTFVECGPGKTLCGLIRKIDRNAAVYQAQDEETLAAAVKALGS